MIQENPVVDVGKDRQLFLFGREGNFSQIVSKPKPGIPEIGGEERLASPSGRGNGKGQPGAFAKALTTT